MPICVLSMTQSDLLPLDYCSSYFSKKVLGKIPETILVRQERSGISRYYVTDEFLP